MNFGFNADDKWRDLGDYQLDHVLLYSSSDDKPYDLTYLISELNIHEDIFGVFMSGNITFKDAEGYAELLPIIGNERIDVKFKTPGTDVFREYTMWVYRVAGKDRMGPDNALLIRLDICSLELLANPLDRISRSLEGTQSDLAGALYGEFFAKYGKPIEIEPARTEIKMNIPSWTPCETICWLTSSAVSAANGTPSFLFYEDCGGFKFKTIEALKDQEPIFDYYSVPHHDKADKQVEVRRVLNITQDLSNNAITSVQSGLFGMKLLNHDPTNKTFLFEKYEWDIGTKLSKVLSVLPAILHGGPSLSNQYTTYRPINEELFDSGPVPTAVTTIDWEGRRKSYLDNMMSTRIVVTVTGNSLIDVGKIVQLTVKSQAVDGSPDYMTTGRYIISALCHHFSGKGHFMSLELVSDGLGSLARKAS